MKKKLLKKLINLIIKTVPPLAKMWEKADGKKTKIGAVEIIIGIGIGTVGFPEAGIPLIVSGGQQLINGILHKASKNNNKNRRSS